MEKNEDDDILVYHTEVNICTYALELPSVYIDAHNDPYYDITEDEVKKYVDKVLYPGNTLKKLICDKIMSGQIKLKIGIRDSDMYSRGDLPDDRIVEIEDFKDSIKGK